MKNFLITLYSRITQKIIFFFSLFLHLRIPEIIDENNYEDTIVSILKSHQIQSVLLVLSSSVYRSGKLNPLIEKIKTSNISYCIYNQIPSNPSIDAVEIGLDKYRENHCQAVIAIGGGSPIDCAKIIAARSTNHQPIKKMRGILKIRHKLPLFIVAPTTAGSGSECTIAAVISDKENKDKYAISDPKLIPQYALLNPDFLLSLPPHVLAETGMDALTHAVESYINKNTTKFSRKQAKEAVKLIFDNLEKAYLYPQELSYKKNMLIASYQAGLSFTRSYVGFVHSIAHALGGQYDISHGLANALLLDKVLNQYGSCAYKKLAELYDVFHDDFSLSNEAKANLFICDIKRLKEKLNIKNTIATLIQDKDIPLLVNHADKEAVPLYPTPRILSKREIKKIILEVKNKED